jgi:hypothetical protein
MNELQTFETLRPDIRQLTPQARAAMRTELFGDAAEGVGAAVDADSGVAIADNPGWADVYPMRFDLEHGVEPLAARAGSRSWLTTAAAVLAVAGVAGLWAAVANRDVNDRPATAQRPASNPADTEGSSAPATIVSSVGPGLPGTTLTGNVVTLPESESDYYEPPWDAIPLATGTIGWFEAGEGLPDEIRALGDGDGAPSVEATAGFFVCSGWTLANGLPTCNALNGGNGIEHVDYGDRLGIGVQLGDTDARTQLWAQSQGSLWGYETVTEPPEPTIIEVGDTDGYSYRDGDHAYLVWEYQPGVVVWLHARGLDDSQLADIAGGVHPAELPDSLPLLLQLDQSTSTEVGPGSNSLNSALKLGYLDGQPCMGFELWEHCTIPDQPAVFGTAVWGDGKADRYAAVAPTGTGKALRVNTDTQGWQTIPLEPTEFGFDVATWSGDTGDRLLEADLVDTAGDTIVTSGPLNPVPGRDSDTIVAEGHTDVAWIVHRQDPEDPNPANMTYNPGDDPNRSPYCLLLSGPSEFTPLCPPDNPPASGIGDHADYHNTLDLAEIATDVTRVTCDTDDMPIFTDPTLDNRRFAVLTCDNPTINP